MNIPEFNNEMKQGLRTESVIPALSEDKSHVRDGTVSPEHETVQKQDEAHGDKQSLNHSKEELEIGRAHV